MRCLACGATNVESADWCNQCYASLTSARTEQPAASAATAAAEPAGTGPGGEPAAEGFRRVDDHVEWQCPSCEQWNSVDSLRCPVCETPLAARWERPDPDWAAGVQARFEVPWGAVLLLSALVPGAGHIGLCRYGSGIARATLYAVWMVGAVVLWQTGGALAGTPLLLGAGVLWAGSLADVAALRAGRRELLGGRALLWLVVGVLAVSMVGLFVAATQAPGLQAPA